jgi:hypothetical protein
MVCRHRAERTFHALESAECPTVQPTIRLRRSVGRSVFCYLHRAVGSKHDFATFTKRYVLRMRPQDLFGICLTLSAMLVGNLVRVLVLFHLPATISSCYESSTGRSTSSSALGALSFALFSVIPPSPLLLRLGRKPTTKLYDETRSLLALGPLYNAAASSRTRWSLGIQ